MSVSLLFDSLTLFFYKCVPDIDVRCYYKSAFLKRYLWASLDIFDCQNVVDGVKWRGDWCSELLGTEVRYCFKILNIRKRRQHMLGCWHARDYILFFELLGVWRQWSAIVQLDLGMYDHFAIIFFSRCFRRPVLAMCVPIGCCRSTQRCAGNSRWQ